MAVAILCAAAMAHAELLTYELYELSGDGGRTLLAKGTREYTVRDLVVTERSAGESTWWSKELPVANGFSAGASIYRRPDHPGFGLWLKDRGTYWGKVANGGFSWDWFDREAGDIYRKLQGGGRVRVAFVQSSQFQEIATVEVVEDITLRVSSRPWFFFFSRGDTHHLVLKKGSVLRFSP